MNISFVSVLVSLQAIVTLLHSAKFRGPGVESVEETCLGESDRNDLVGLFVATHGSRSKGSLYMHEAVIPPP